MKERKDLEKLIETEDIRAHEVKIAETTLAKTDLDIQQTHRYERIKTVALELLRGMSPSQIAEKYTEEWNIKFDVIRIHYTIDARKMLAENLVTEEQDIRNDLLAKYYYLYQLNMKNSDLKEAHALLNSIAKLTQTFQQHVHVFGQINTVQLIEVMKDELKDAEEIGISDTSDE
jgi:hypothetical protein